MVFFEQGVFLEAISGRRRMNAYQNNIRISQYQKSSISGKYTARDREKDKGCGALNFEALGNVGLNRTD